MKIKTVVKNVLPTSFTNLIRWWRRKTGRSLVRRDRPHDAPWSPSFHYYRREFIASCVQNESLLERFRNQESLPAHYGIGMDERCVEYPWLFTHLKSGPGNLLDAGSVLNYDFLLRLPQLLQKRIHMITLTPEQYWNWNTGPSYLFCDLRDIPIRDAFFDTIVCISTLEHVGFNNSLFTGSDAHRENQPQAFRSAMREMARVLKAGGRLLLTVPYGVHRDLDFQQIFDQSLLEEAVEAFGQAAGSVCTFYRYTAAGWNISTQEDCSDCEYVQWIVKGWLENRWPQALRLEPDKAVAARSVACVEMVKS